MEEINKELEVTYSLINNSYDKLIELVKKLPAVAPAKTGTTKKVKIVDTEGDPEDNAKSTKKKVVSKKRVTKGTKKVVPT